MVATPAPSTGTTTTVPGVATFTIPADSAAGSTSPYGLTDKWGSTAVDLTGFPLPVLQALTQAGLDTSQKQTGDTVAAALANIKNPAVVSQVQQMLFYGGFYPNSVTNLTQIQLGKFQAPDISALGSLIQTGGQTGQPLGSYLVSSANYGQAQGTINKIAGVGVTPIAIPADADIDAALKASAQNILGHDPSAEQLAGFRAIYDQLVIASNKQTAALQAKQAAQTAALSQNPDAVGEAAGRLGLPGYFGDPQEAPPAPAPPFYLAKPGGPSLPQPGTQVQGRGISSVTNPNAAADNAADYYNQHTQDQDTVAQFAGAGANALANSQPTVTAAPSLSSASDQFLEQDDPGAVQTQRWAQVTQSLYSILAGKGY